MGKLLQIITIVSIMFGAYSSAINAQMPNSAHLNEARANKQMGDRDRTHAENEDKGWVLYVGTGAFYAPTYSGDDEYSLSMVPYLRLIKGDVFFASVQEGVGYALVNQANGLRMGPVARIDFGRDETGSRPFRLSGKNSQDLIGLGDVAATISLGGFAEYKIDDFMFKLQAGRALGSHEGITAEAAVNFEKRIMALGPPLFLKIGPRIKWADDAYNQAYYGISDEQFLYTGLARYEADSGIISYGLGANMLMPLSYNIGLMFFGRYEHLTNEVANSPLIRLHGSPDQLQAGAAIAYRF